MLARGAALAAVLAVAREHVVDPLDPVVAAGLATRCRPASRRCRSGVTAPAATRRAPRSMRHADAGVRGGEGRDGAAEVWYANAEGGRHAAVLHAPGCYEHRRGICCVAPPKRDASGLASASPCVYYTSRQLRLCKGVRMDRHELRARRLALGLSQAQLAALWGVTKDTVSRWERGAVPLQMPGPAALGAPRPRALPPPPAPRPAPRADAREGCPVIAPSGRLVPLGARGGVPPPAPPNTCPGGPRPHGPLRPRRLIPSPTNDSHEATVVEPVWRGAPLHGAVAGARHPPLRRRGGAALIFESFEDRAAPSPLPRYLSAEVRQIALLGV